MAFPTTVGSTASLCQGKDEGKGDDGETWNDPTTGITYKGSCLTTKSKAMNLVSSVIMAIGTVLVVNQY